MTFILVHTVNSPYRNPNEHALDLETDRTLCGALYRLIPSWHSGERHAFDPKSPKVCRKCRAEANRRAA